MGVLFGEMYSSALSSTCLLNFLVRFQRCLSTTETKDNLYQLFFFALKAYHASEMFVVGFFFFFFFLRFSQAQGSSLKGALFKCCWFAGLEKFFPG